MLTPVTLTADGIHFPSYPFRPASVYPGASLAWPAVREVVLNGYPPEVRTRQGEVLFVARGQKDELAAAAQQHAIACVRRVDVWGLLLEPFLDTELSDIEQAGTERLLAQSGISAHEAATVRNRFAALMYAYNFGTGLWEWAHLGLYDLFLAYHLATSGELRAQVASDFQSVYWWAMRIAERAQLQELPPA